MIATILNSILGKNPIQDFSMAAMGKKAYVPDTSMSAMLSPLGVQLNQDGTLAPLPTPVAAAPTPAPAPAAPAATPDATPAVTTPSVAPVEDSTATAIAKKKAQAQAQQAGGVSSTTLSDSLGG